MPKTSGKKKTSYFKNMPRSFIPRRSRKHSSRRNRSRTRRSAASKQRFRAVRSFTDEAEKAKAEAAASELKEFLAKAEAAKRESKEFLAKAEAAATRSFLSLMEFLNKDTQNPLEISIGHPEADQERTRAALTRSIPEQTSAADEVNQFINHQDPVKIRVTNIKQRVGNNNQLINQFLYIFHINKENKVAVLFPNRADTDNGVTGVSEAVIPTRKVTNPDLKEGIPFTSNFSVREQERFYAVSLTNPIQTVLPDNWFKLDVKQLLNVIEELFDIGIIEQVSPMLVINTYNKQFDRKLDPNFQ